MVVRIVQFLLGALFLGGGGYLGWAHRETAMIFPPGHAGLPLLFLLGLLGLTTGAVFIVSAVHPRPNQRRMLADKASRDDDALAQAEVYYSNASHLRAADRDWRASPINPPPAAPTAAEAPPLPAASAIEPKPAARDPKPAEPKPMAPKPVQAAPPPPPASHPAPARPFPSNVTLTPLPRAGETLSEPGKSAGPATQMIPPVDDRRPADDRHNAIRSALSSGQLDEAERLLDAAREEAAGLELAELTALAGYHAAASGQKSHARWFWRLAMRRFTEQQALDSPAAKAVAANLRTLA